MTFGENWSLPRSYILPLAKKPYFSSSLRASQPKCTFWNKYVFEKIKYEWYLITDGLHCHPSFNSTGTYSCYETTMTYRVVSKLHSSSLIILEHGICYTLLLLVQQPTPRKISRYTNLPMWHCNSIPDNSWPTPYFVVAQFDCIYIFSQKRQWRFVMVKQL